MAVESVNFVHSYKKDQISTYELRIEDYAQGDEIVAEFELSIKSSPKDGKTKATFTYSVLEMDGQDMAEMLSPIEFELTKHGVPTNLGEYSDNDPKLIAFVTLLTTYLPAESLDEGETFKVKMPGEVLSYDGSGKFVGIETVDGKQLAVLSSRGTLTDEGETADIKIKTYYDPVGQRVVKSTAEIDLEDESFDLELKLKK